MLVGYSSSSDEEGSAEDAANGAGGSSSKRAENAAAGDSFPLRKKLKTEKQLPKTRYIRVIACERMEFVFFHWGDSKYNFVT